MNKVLLMAVAMTMAATADIAPDGSYVGGEASIAPDGSWVGE